MILTFYMLIALVIFAILLHEICKTYTKLTLGDLILSFICGFSWPLLIIAFMFIVFIHCMDLVMSQSIIKAIFDIEIVKCREDL